MSPEAPKFTGWWHGTYFVDGMTADPPEEIDDKPVIGCDKPAHALRSLHHQPNHAKHWKNSLDTEINAPNQPVEKGY